MAGFQLSTNGRFWVSTEDWVTVVPVLDRDSGEFLGTVTSHDLLDLVALMDEIEDEVQRQGAGA